MTVEVREADVDLEGETLLAALNRDLPNWGGREKYDWLYRRNPLGRARCWTLRSESNEIVGLSSAFPRELQIGERFLTGWVLGDFCVSKNQRSLGPAICLQREACRAVDEAQGEFWYDFPSQAMLAVYRRMGLPPTGRFWRLVHLLRVERELEKRRVPRLFFGVSCALGNAALALRQLRKRDTQVTVDARSAPFASEALRWTNGGIAVRQSVAYLNWRYFSDPRGGIEVLGDSNNERDEAVIVSRQERDLFILDAPGILDERRLQELVREVIAIGRSRGAMSVEVGISGQHPWLRVFEGLHFRRRESVPFVAYRRLGTLEPDSSWFLMGGDRDQ